MKTILATLLCLALLTGAQAQRVAFWNIENLFDTQADSTINDAEYTPGGSKNWTPKRYQAKLDQLYKTIAAMDFPLVMGLAEVENDKVLRDLCQHTPLFSMHYQYCHFDSPDPRGIDCALIYRKDHFTLLEQSPIRVSDSTKHLYTRDILKVIGVTRTHDTLALFVVHLPSKRNGAIAERNRIHIAAQLRRTMDSISEKHPMFSVIVLGDFNATPQEKTFSHGLELPCEQYVDLLADRHHQGTYYYRGAWQTLDHIILSTRSSQTLTADSASIFSDEYVTSTLPHRMEKKPHRTYAGDRYLGGASDHLPVYVDLRRKNDLVNP